MCFVFKGAIILLSLFSLTFAEELGRPYEVSEDGEVAAVESQFPGMGGMGGMMGGMGGPMMGMGGMMGPMGGMMGGMGGMPMNGGGNCPCQPACQPCMPWTPCQPCSCPCSPAPTTPRPEDSSVGDGPICVNGAPNEFFPDCCFNGGRGKFW